MNEEEKQPAIDKAEQLGPTTLPADEDVTHDDGSTFDDGTTYA